MRTAHSTSKIFECNLTIKVLRTAHSTSKIFECNLTIKVLRTAHSTSKIFECNLTIKVLRTAHSTSKTPKKFNNRPGPGSGRVRDDPILTGTGIWPFWDFAWGRDYRKKEKYDDFWVPQKCAILSVKMYCIILTKMLLKIPAKIPAKIRNWPVPGLETQSRRRDPG